MAMRGRSKGVALSSFRCWLRANEPVGADWSAHPPKCGYSTGALPERIQAFPESQLEVVKDVDGASFLRLPQFLCDEWGYVTADCEPLLLKRDCYDVLCSKIDGFFKTPRAKSVVVLGNPGIGKSAYCVYLLWHLVQDGERNAVVSLNRDPDAVRQLVKQHRGRVWYLADKRVPMVHWTLPGHCHFVLTCSPAKENHFQFSKYPVTATYYLPVWSKEEIMQLNKAVFKLPDQDVHEAFKLWGGIPRHVLANRSRFSDIHLFSAIKSEARQMVVDVPGNNYSIEKEEDYLQVYHYDVDVTSCELHDEFWPLKFASDFVAAGVARLLRPSLIDNIAGGHASEKLRASLFDAFFHCLLERNISVSSKEMDEQGKWGPLLNEDLPLARFEFAPKSVGNNAVLPPFILDCTVVRPESRSNRSWDLILGRRVLQATVTSRRDGKKLEVTEGLVDALSFLRRCYGDGTKLELIYFVPSKMFESFTPTLPGGVNAVSRAEAVKRFTTKLNVKVKKMCLHVDQSLADVATLKAFNLLNLASPTCRLAQFTESKTFDAMGLRASLLQGISDCGYKVPTPLQQSAIAAFCAGLNVLKQGPRGSGCTTALCVSVLQRVDLSRGPFQAVVVATSRNDALQIMRQMLGLRSNDVNLKVRCFSSDGAEEWHVLVGTPPDVYEACNRLPKDSLVSLSVLGMDDADEISKTFGLEEVRLLVSLMPEQRQFGIFGSTMPAAVLDFVSQETKCFVC
ncbi:uncharacterized protein LOC9650920 [Selaginella moellendorffii]|uniref:uncharacterized protein LOC9650920 n=1 Tax=Selaginella moellendorffii TaxID=88036 RepID=UPI000D1D0B91|nr:uncharacterized protein LOC9650920 [Selaginella moellendorffii]|eukprot:XP_024521628.1 uncharacterized protein LOC9650920 [Selaginella moellendorffii]